MEDDFPSPLSSSKRSACSASPSVKKRPKIDWSPIQLNVLEEANDFITSLWPNFQPAFHSDAEGTDPERRRALAGILSTLTTKLHATGMRDSDFTPRQAQVIVDGFDDKALGDWMVSVKKGMEGNWTDWMDLIEHPLFLKRNVAQDPPNIETMEHQAIRLQTMFFQKYQGNAVESFIDGLDVYSNIYDQKRHYGQCITLVQSSGTGKSRLIRELGKKVPTLSVCFRKSHRPTSGWPPGDKPAYDFFESNSGSSEYNGEELAAAFIGALAYVIANKLVGRINPGSSPKTLMEDWVLEHPTDVTGSLRFGSFMEVKAKAEDLLRENRDQIKKSRLQSPKPNDDTPRISANYHRELYITLCKDHTNKLSEIITNAGYARFVIAFDECSLLNFPTTSKYPTGGAPSRRPSCDMSLIALRRIIKAGGYFDEHIWYLLLDTTPSIFDLAPSGPQSPSDRLTNDLTPLPVWPYLGFNQMVPAGHSEGIKTAAQALTMEHLKVYGRPVSCDIPFYPPIVPHMLYFQYWSLLENIDVLQAATQKLFYQPSPALSVFNPANENHVLAAFSIRIGLEIGEGEESQRLAREAVRSHMRILRRAIGSLVITACPSEPTLAIAAATALNRSPQVYRTAIMTLVDRLVLRGVVLDRGLQGELCSRLLLTLARDQAVSPDSFVDNGPKGPNIRPVKLSRFLETLLGDDLGISEKESCTEFLSTVSGIWINFTHFVQLTQPLAKVTPGFLCEAWSSGMAFQCAFRQAVVGGFFVGYKGELDAPFDSSNLVIISLQTKGKAASTELVGALTSPPIVEELNGKTIWRKPDTPVILMDLAASASFKQTDKRIKVQLTRTAAKRPTGGKEGMWQGYASGNGQQEPIRYCLNIRGHDSLTYPVLSEIGVGTLFSQLLGHLLAYFLPFQVEMDDDMERVVC